jgi:hypothetical protein
MKKSLPSAMAEVVRGGDFSSFGARDRERNSSAGPNGLVEKPKSPRNRFGLRSNSPRVGQDPDKFVLDDGRLLDKSSAYRRLSDASLALSQGGLSSLTGKKSRRRTNSGTGVGSSTSGLEKGYAPIDGEDALLDSSDEDYSDEEQRRGRKKDSRPGPESQTLGMERGKGSRTTRSLMAAAKEER